MLAWTAATWLYLTAAAELNDSSCAHYMLFVRLCFVLCASCDNKQPGAEQVVCAVSHVPVIWWSSNFWWTEAALKTHRKGSVGSLCCAFCSLLSGIHLKWRLQSNPVTQKSFFVTTYYKSYIYLHPPDSQVQLRQKSYDTIWHASSQFTYCSVETSHILVFIYYCYCIMCLV